MDNDSRACRSFKNGNCKFGDNCRFRHEAKVEGEEEKPQVRAAERKTAPFDEKPAKIVCKNIERGRLCRYGDTCKYSHDISELAAVEKANEVKTVPLRANTRREHHKVIKVPSSSASVRVAVTQFQCSSNIAANVAKAEQLVRDAANGGAKIILLQELFASLYFCQEQNNKYFTLASQSSSENPFLTTFSKLAKELNVVLPISFFEKKNTVFYNSIVIIDANGENLGLYRKTHIPDGPGYSEKFYFSPGDTGFKVFKTAYGTIGVGICWDQWFPECARSMALMGADILLYPTAIGSEPQDATIDSCGHWTRAMVGHSASNMIPVMASNRIGTEVFSNSRITFYGSSFITDNTGGMLATLDRHSEGIGYADLELEKHRNERASWGMFRDRRPEMYGRLLTKDGELKMV